MKLFSSTRKPRIAARERREAAPAVVAGDAQTFAAFGLSPSLVRALAQLRITTPTPVQRECIPQLLAYRPVLGGSATGSGKTLAFALPILHNLLRDPYTCYAVVVTPTHELAVQIVDQFEAVGSQNGVLVAQVVGGMNETAMMRALDHQPHVLVVTPKRFVDALAHLPFSLDQTRYVVFDEADVLFDPATNMLADVRAIEARLPATAVKAYFTATASRLLALLPPAEVPTARCCVGEDVRANPECAQRYVFAPQNMKHVYVAVLVRTRPAIVFCSSILRAEVIHRMLRSLDVPATALHSALPYRLRLANLRAFRSGEAPVLVATDVAARGLDIPAVPLVVNYDVPAAPATYVHRVGRTARAGRSGRAVTLVDDRSVAAFKAIEAALGARLEEEPVEERRVLDTVQRATAAKEVAFLSLRESKIYKRVQLDRRRRGGE